MEDILRSVKRSPFTRPPRIRSRRPSRFSNEIHEGGDRGVRGGPIGARAEENAARDASTGRRSGDARREPRSPPVSLRREGPELSRSRALRLRATGTHVAATPHGWARSESFGIESIRGFAERRARAKRCTGKRRRHGYSSHQVFRSAEVDRPQRRSRVPNARAISRGGNAI
jgi:hypothetical protein